MSAYHDKNQESCKIGIGFDYEDTKDKKSFSYTSKTPSKEKGPQILKNVPNPVFKRTTIDFDEELLVIKQQLLDEENNQEGENSCPKVNEKLKANTNAESSEKEKQTSKKKKPNRNGKVGINKNNNYAYLKNAPRKICMNYGSSNHLTHMYKKPKNKDKNEFNLGHQIPLLEKAYHFCDNFD